MKYRLVKTGFPDAAWLIFLAPMKKPGTVPSGKLT